MVLAGNANDARQKRFRRTEWTVACSPDAKGREEMVRVVVDGGVTKPQLLAASTPHPRRRQWVDRFRKHGIGGLRDRSSRPHSSSNLTRYRRALRRQRYTGKQIARELGVSTATISGIQQRLGLYKLKNFWNRARWCAATNRPCRH